MQRIFEGAILGRRRLLPPRFARVVVAPTPIVAVTDFPPLTFLPRRPPPLSQLSPLPLPPAEHLPHGRCQRVLEAGVRVRRGQRRRARGGGVPLARGVVIEPLPLQRRHIPVRQFDLQQRRHAAVLTTLVLVEGRLVFSR